MIYGVSKSKIRKLLEKMISINFLSINVDYVSIFIQESEVCSFSVCALYTNRCVFLCVSVYVRESCKRKQSTTALEVYNLCNLSVEMNWVIYWKTQSQEDWISTAYPRAPIHQVPINNLTIEF